MDIHAPPPPLQHPPLPENTMPPLSPPSGLPFLVNYHQPVPDFSDMVMDEFWGQDHHQQHPPPPVLPFNCEGGPGSMANVGNGYDTFTFDPMTGNLQLQNPPTPPPPLPSPSPQRCERRSMDQTTRRDLHNTEEEDNEENAEDGDMYGSDSDFVIEEDDLSSLDCDERSNPNYPLPAYLPPSVMNTINSSNEMRVFSTYSAGALPLGGMHGGNGVRSHLARGASRGGRGVRGRRKGSLDVHQMSRRLKQKAESYERKKNRAKACRKVLKERFDTLLKVCGDPHIRRSDKVGLLTRAIDLILALRRQAVAQKEGALRPPLPMQHRPQVFGPWKGGEVGYSLPPGQSVRPHKRLSRSSTPGSSQQEPREGEVEEGTEGLRNGRGRARRTSVQWLPVNSFHPPCPPPGALAPSPCALPAPWCASEGWTGRQLLQECLGSPQATRTLLACLDPASLETCRGVAASAWKSVASADSPWKELCRLRWQVKEEAMEEMFVAAAKGREEGKGWKDGAYGWREVYLHHALALRLPLLPRAPATDAVEAQGGATGVCGWLLAGESSFIPLPSPAESATGPQALLSLRLVVQNVAQDVITLPFQRFQVWVRATLGGTREEVESEGKGAKEGAEEGEGEDKDEDGLPRRSISHTSSTTTATCGSSEEEGEEREEHRGGVALLKEPTMTQLKSRGLHAASYQCALLTGSDEAGKGEGSLPWSCYEGVGGLRMTLFDTAVLAFYVLVHGNVGTALGGVPGEPWLGRRQPARLRAETVRKLAKQLEFIVYVPEKAGGRTKEGKDWIGESGARGPRVGRGGEECEDGLGRKVGVTLTPVEGPGRRE